MLQLLYAIITIVLGVGLCVGYFFLANWLIDNIIFPARGKNINRNINLSNIIRPWIFMGPAILALVIYLVYPVFKTLELSFLAREGRDFVWVGADNYAQMLGDPKFREALLNNSLWLIVVPGLSTAFGLLVAQLTDRINWGNIAKALIFMPMAISFVGASVIWKLVYDARPIGQEQIGILNALYIWFTANEPQNWLTIPFWNNLFLMVVLVWIQTGFAMVILSAALRSIPEETVEAAVLDGANPFQIFFYIKVPQIYPTIIVVWTTITVVVLKIFDIVFAMTNGQWKTQVLANYMFDQLFSAGNWGVGSAAAMIIMLLVLPILLMNIRNARRELQ